MSPLLTAAPRASAKPSISTRVRLDVALFVGYFLLSAPQSTGIAFHEWFTVVFIPIFIAHVVMDWAWIAAVFRRASRARTGEVRFNRAFDVVLFVTMVVVIYSGFLVSEVMLPALGFELAESDFWFTVHDAGGNLLILLLGIHLAMHWPWVRRNLPRLLRRGARA